MDKDILLKVLKYVGQNGEWLDAPDLSPQYTEEEVHAHIGYCADKNWLEVSDITGFGMKYRRYHIKRMTAFGYGELARLESSQQSQSDTPPRRIGFKGREN